MKGRMVVWVAGGDAEGWSWERERDIKMDCFLRKLSILIILFFKFFLVFYFLFFKILRWHMQCSARATWPLTAHVAYCHVDSLPHGQCHVAIGRLCDMGKKHVAIVPRVTCPRHYIRLLIKLKYYILYNMYL
jgi:hypothetical protein